MINITIENFRDEDLPYILEQQKELFSLNFKDEKVIPSNEDVEMLFTQCSDKAFVIKENGKNIGFYLYMSDDFTKRCILAQIFINKEHRNKGFGKMLMEHFELQLKERNIDEYELEVSVMNRSAVKFYEKIGCIHEEEFEELNELRFFMSKNVKGEKHDIYS